MRNRRLTRSLLSSDLRRNKAVNLTLLLFMFLSAVLMASGMLVIDRLSGSLDRIFAVAKPPHFLQMHVGPVDRDAVQRFADRTGGVEAVQVQDMANIDGTQITFARVDGSTGSLGDSLLDNYFVAQNPSFDFLLDSDNQVVHPAPGHLGVPVGVLTGRGLAVGDRMTIEQDGQAKTFTVAYAVRDAQMGSSMASSTRFLMNDADFRALYAGAVNRESIVGFRLLEPGRANAFQAAYVADGAAMPRNGQAITYDLIRLVDGLGDGLMSAVIILVSLVLIGIAMLNVRFTLLATLEEEVREIGTLKAVGLTDRDIRGLYQAKYRALALIACLLAAAAAYPLAGLFTRNIALNFGLSEPTWLTWLLPFAAVAVIYLIVMGLLRRILGRISKLTIVQALTEGTLPTAGRRVRRVPALPKSAARRPDLRLALHDYRLGMRSWALLTVVFLLATTIILVPLNLLTTLESPRFVRYMGTAASDVRIDLQQRPELVAETTAIHQRLAGDPAVAAAHGFTTYRTQIQGENGSEGFLIETGDYAAFPVELQVGVLPAGDDQIALSVLNADRLGLGVGDTLDLGWDGVPHTFRVTGIYQDITNGGLTAKTTRADLGGDAVRHTAYVNLRPGTPVDTFTAGYAGDFPGAKVIGMDAYRAQTLGTITDSLSVAVQAVIVLALAISALIAVLFMKLLLHKRFAIDAALRAIGYRVRALRVIYLIQGALAAGLGVGLGVLASLTLGQWLVGGVFGVLGLGVRNLTFILSPALFVLVGCLLPLAIGLGATWAATRDVRRASVLQLGNA